MTMTRGTLEIGAIRGIPIRVHPSWLIALLLIASSLSVDLAPSWGAAAPIAALAAALVFFASILAHELAHSIVALRLGTPVDSITLFVFGGVAAIGREPRRARDELAIAAAGPAASAVIGVASLFVARAGLLPEMVAAPLDWIGRANVGVAVFNCLPGFPLDGGRITRALLWLRWRDPMRATRVAAGIGRGIAYAFFGLGALAAVTGALVSGLYLLLLGAFLRSAATSALFDVAVREALEGTYVWQLMTRDAPYAMPPGSERWPAIAPTAPIAEALSLLAEAPLVMVRDARGVWGFLERERVHSFVYAALDSRGRRAPRQHHAESAAE